jgi:hypothetical protein
MKLFKCRIQSVIAYCIDVGGRHVRFDWAAIDRKTLDLRRVQEISIEDPVDEYWDYALYVCKTFDASSVL